MSGDGLPVVPRERYLVVREVGRGGLGRVLEARDLRLDRAVALKELLDGSGDAPARFLREALVTARLEHPAVVPIHEAGRWPSGEPFYAMKLVSGQTLDAAIAAAGGLAGRMALLPHVIAVADAVAYAHSLRVIHRDLKPANVICGAFGETVVIDWGLAKDLNDPERLAQPGHSSGPGLTVAGSVVGTPGYMPPEQAAGETVDERADVYAIGAILYQLLAGVPPHAGALEAVLVGPPPSLMTQEPEIPPDLVALVERAMAREPALRYPSARELAEELKRFQAGQLVAAHRYSPGQLLGRWLRQHRAAVAVAGVAAALLLVAGVVGVRRIVAEERLAENQKHIADQRRADVEDLMGFMLYDLRDKLVGIGRIDLLAAVTGKASEYYDRNDAETVVDPHKRTAALLNLGDVLLAQGDAPAGLARFRAGLAMAERLAAAAPDDTELQRDVAIAHQRLGTTLATVGSLAAGLDELRAGLAVAERLAAADRGNGKLLRDVGVEHTGVGDVLKLEGDSPGALAEYRAALAVAVQLTAIDASNVVWQHDLSAAHQEIADLLAAGGDVPAALLEYRAAVAIAEQVLAAAPDDAAWQRELAFSDLRLARLLLLQGKPSEALPPLRRSQEIRERLAARDPSNAEHQSDLTVGHQHLGDALLALGDQAGALSEYRAGLEISEKLAARDPQNTRTQQGLSVGHNRLGAFYEERHDLAGALREYRAALAIRERLAAQDPDNLDALRSLSLCHDNIGDALVAQHDAAGALPHYRASLAVAERLAARDPANADWQRDLSISHENVGLALAAQGDPAAAFAEYGAAVAIRERLVASSPGNAQWRHDLAVGHGRRGDALMAQKARQRARAEYRAEVGLLEPLLAAAPGNHEWQQDLAKARASLRRSK